MREEFPSSENKELQWKAFAERFKNETDGLGKEIEPGILDVVIGLNALGVNTFQSCEGHLDKGRISPWVIVEAPGQPKKIHKDVLRKSEKKRYLEKGLPEELLVRIRRADRAFKQSKAEIRNMKERDAVIQPFLDQFGITPEELKQARGIGQLVYDEKYVHADEYKAWMEEDRKVAVRAADLVAEFNLQREGQEDKPDNSCKIILEKEGLAIIHNGGSDYETAEQERSSGEKEELQKRLAAYQKEFKKFAAWLEKKYKE